MVRVYLPLGDGCFFLEGCRPCLVGCITVDCRLGHDSGRACSFQCSFQKGRHHLRCKIAGRKLYGGRIVAWAFCNPDNVPWRSFEGRRDRRRRRMYWECCHLGSEVDYRRMSLRLDTSANNLNAYRRIAVRRYGQVLRQV